MKESVTGPAGIPARQPQTVPEEIAFRWLDRAKAPHSLTPWEIVLGAVEEAFASCDRGGAARQSSSSVFLVWKRVDERLDGWTTSTDSSVLAVFASREAAEKFRDRERLNYAPGKRDDTSYDIEEMGVL